MPPQGDGNANWEHFGAYRRVDVDVVQYQEVSLEASVQWWRVWVCFAHRGKWVRRLGVGIQ